MSGRATFGRVWRVARDRLADAGIETAALDARLLAERAFGVSRLELMTRENDAATPEGLATFDAFIVRRRGGEPVARILGEKEFYGLTFALNEATLVPRPETELLVDLALDWLQGRGGAMILDLGTGSGCIPVAILANAPRVRAVAVDLSARALQATRENAERHGVSARIEVLEGSWFTPLRAPTRGKMGIDGYGTMAPQAEDDPLPLVGRAGEGGRTPARFDLILSNPPYIESTALPALAPDVRNHDPHLALDGGPDGLAPYRIIATEAPSHLKPGGALMVEIGSSQGAVVANLFAAAGFSDVAIHKDLAGLDRVVVGHHL